MKLSICAIASEVVPLAKSGGLADVASALSRELTALGHDVRLFMPFYSQIRRDRIDAVRVETLQGLPIVTGRHEYRVDVWRALAGTLGYILTQIKSHAPARQGSRRRPGAADLWQAVYLGVSEVFVTSDVRQLDAVSQISAVLRYPRCVVDTAAFFEGLTCVTPDPAVFCRRCGSTLLETHAGTPSFHTTA